MLIHRWRLQKHRLTADKREIKDFPKLPSATSFIHQTLYAIVKEGMCRVEIKYMKKYILV